MQKSLVIVLAVCLISVHAFVKREAPVAGDNTNYIEKIQKEVENIRKLVSDKVNPEEVKKGFEDMMKEVQGYTEQLSKVIDSKSTVIAK